MSRMKEEGWKASDNEREGGGGGGWQKQKLYMITFSIFL